MQFWRAKTDVAHTVERTDGYLVVPRWDHARKYFLCEYYTGAWQCALQWESTREHRSHLLKDGRLVHGTPSSPDSDIISDHVMVTAMRGNGRVELLPVDLNRLC